MTTLWIVASSIGGAVLVALVVVYRRAVACRELELAEQALDAEFGSPLYAAVARQLPARESTR